MSASAGGLSSMFNGVTIGAMLFSAVFEIGMHIFVHYTVPGMGFAAWLAEALGVTASAGLEAISTEAVTTAAEPVFTFD